MNNQIISKPPDYIQYGRGLNSCYTNIWTGEYVYYRFYEQGHWKENNICNALKEINWVPKKGKMYKCWWYSTNPSDPSDTGEDILLYVENWDTYIDKPNIRSKIIDKLYDMNDDELLDLSKKLNIIK